MISIIQNPTLAYPGEEDSFSPSERYPEYKFDHVAARPNQVYAAVRELFRQAGLDAAHFGTPRWNPLGRWITPGRRVFILCNFVQERRVNQGREELLAKCVHGSVLRVLCDFVLIALGGEGAVTFGNAPLQATNWAAVLRETGAASVERFYTQRSAPVRSADLRMVVRSRSVFGHSTVEEERDSNRDCVEIDLQNGSLLAELDKRGREATTRFRVMNYDGSLTEGCQGQGKHLYIISREILESDVIVSLPKLKTHEKVGVTCGLKGYVGIVGHKSCLAHHRFGGADLGGDEYPRSSSIRRWQSSLHDFLYAARSPGSFRKVGMMLDTNLARVISRLGGIYGGAWHGNDTCWRMALDLARIAHYATKNGQMTTTMQRTNLSLIDGIVAGEGKGPLSPSPVRAGILLFGDNVAIADAAACRLMGFREERIPLVHQALRPEMFYPIVDRKVEGTAILNGAQTAISSLDSPIGRPFLASPGWKDHLC